MTPIADMVEKMLASGVAHDLVVMAIRIAEEARNSTGIPVDKSAEKRRAWDRERKRRKTHSTGNSTGIPPESLARVEENITNSVVQDTEIQKSEKGSRRGLRLPPDWLPSQADVDEARLIGLTPIEIQAETSKFCDYWHARAGPGGVKLDWSATWRNWCRTAVERRKGNGNHRKQNLSELAFDMADEVRERERAAGIIRPDDPVRGH